MTRGYDDMADVFEQLAEDTIRHYEQRVRRIQSPKNLLRTLHRAWVRVVQRSAVYTRGAPISHIVRQGYDIGWRVWGKYSKSKARFDVRMALFRPVYQRLVREWYLAQLREEG